MGAVFLISMIPVIFILVGLPLLQNIPKDKMQKFKESIKNFFNLKKSWFKIVFALSSAILGFTVLNNEIGGKIMGAILFFVIGLGISWVLDFWINKIKSKTIIIILEVLLCVLLLFFTVTREFVQYHEPSRKYYDNHGNVHYSEEERDEQNFVNDMYEATYDD